MASVTGLLSNNDLFQTHLARDLDLYTRVDDEDWAEGAHAQPYSKADGLVDFDRLASSNGLRTTENLIDALFNPVPTANAQPSPFTFYDPAKAHEAEVRAAVAERQSTHSSVDSSLSMTNGSMGKAASVYTTGSGDSGGTGAGPDVQHRTWWRKIRSRPGTPMGSKGFRPGTPQSEYPRVPS